MATITTLPDNLICFEVFFNGNGIENSTFYTNYVKMTKSPFDKHCELHYIDYHNYYKHLGEENNSNSYLNPVQKYPGADMSLDDLIKYKVSHLKPEYQKNVRILTFGELPEVVKKNFRKFEPWAKLNLDIVDWTVSFEHPSIFKE